MYQLPPDPFGPETTRRLIHEHRPRPVPTRRRTSIGVVIGVTVVLATICVLTLRGPTEDRAGADLVATSTAHLDQRAHVDLTHPYQHTPAQDWAEGEQGIVTPPPTPIGRYTSEQVATALGKVRALIIAARLDRQVIEYHDPEPVLALLAPGQAATIRPQLRPGNEAHTWWVTVKIATGYPLLPVTPRVTGTMTTALDDDGELIIHTNYVVAYAFDTPHPEMLTGPLDIVAVDRWEAAYRWIDNPAYDAESQGIYYGPMRGHQFSIGCALHRQGFTAPDYTNRVWTGTPAERPAEAYFDPSQPMPTKDGC
ncbi:hypothetical protein [Nocardia thailandica]|uniref:hypothetical protein n=1 Tax=Nocardia thailandica TaxID=257275 RepID=UPI0002EFB627|nr:hypothetical protein [Nocardia thailandica]